MLERLVRLVFHVLIHRVERDNPRDPHHAAEDDDGAVPGLGVFNRHPLDLRRGIEGRKLPPVRQRVRLFHHSQALLQRRVALLRALQPLEHVRHEIRGNDDVLPARHPASPAPYWG